MPKSPVRKITRLGLDQLLNQIVTQASGQQAYPPTGTTTTTAVPPAPVTPVSSGPSMQPASPPPNRLVTPTAMNPSYLAPGVTSATAAQFGPAVGVNSPNTGNAASYGLPGAPQGGRDANGDFIVAEGTSMGPAPIAGVNATPVAAPVSNVNGQTAGAPVNGNSSGPSVSQYRNIGEIYAEQPESNDPASKWRFNQNRLTKIGKFYGLSDEEISQAQANVSGMLALAIQKPGITPVEANQLADQMFQAEGTRIVKSHDQGAYDLTHAGPGGTVTPTFEGSASGTPGTMADANPLSVYGVYTPEQIAAIQGQIGQYVNQYQDRYSEAAGGWKPSPAMLDAYARQAQAIPAVQALEGQHALAQELARVKEQNLYYQMMAQMPQQSSSASGSMSDEDMAAFVNSLTTGK